MVAVPIINLHIPVNSRTASETQSPMYSNFTCHCSIGAHFGKSIGFAPTPPLCWSNKAILLYSQAYPQFPPIYTTIWIQSDVAQAKIASLLLFHSIFATERTGLEVDYTLGIRKLAIWRARQEIRQEDDFGEATIRLRSKIKRSRQSISKRR